MLYSIRLQKQKSLPPQTVGPWLFPAILVATVMQSYFDIRAILDGGNLNLATYEGPIILKALKDVLYLWFLASIIWTINLTKRWPCTWPPFLFSMITLISFLISAALNNITIAAIGLRWIIPLIIFLFARDIAARISLKHGIFWIFIGMVTCLGAQVYELFNMPPIYGEILGGWPARTPGFFLAPNSAAFFACSCCACLSVFAYQQQRIRIVSAFLALVICLLAQSGTGIVTAVILFVWIVSGRFTLRFILIAVVTGILIFVNLDVITMRDDYVATSGGNRVDVFFDILGSALTSIGNFGIYTNAGTLQENIYAINFAADSLWASWFGNFGLLAPIQIVLIAFFVIRDTIVVNWRVALPCVLVFLLFSMTTIVFEAFPMNLLLGIGIWASHNVLHRHPTYGSAGQRHAKVTIDHGAPI